MRTIYQNRLNFIEHLLIQLDGIFNPLIINVGLELKGLFSEEKLKLAWKTTLKFFPKLNSCIQENLWVYSPKASHFLYSEGNKNFQEISLESYKLSRKDKFNSLLYCLKDVQRDSTKLFFSIHHTLLDGYGIWGIIKFYMNILSGNNPEQELKKFFMPESVKLPLCLPHFKTLVPRGKISRLPIDNVEEPRVTYQMLHYNRRYKVPDVLYATVKSYDHVFRRDKNLDIFCRFSIPLRQLMFNKIHDFYCCPLYNLASTTSYYFKPEDRLMEQCVAANKFLSQCATQALGTLYMIKYIAPSPKRIAKKLILQRNRLQSYNASFTLAVIGNVSTCFGKFLNDVQSIHTEAPYPGAVLCWYNQKNKRRFSLALSSYGPKNVELFAKKVNENLLMIADYSLPSSKNSSSSHRPKGHSLEPM